MEFRINGKTTLDGRPFTVGDAVEVRAALLDDMRDISVRLGGKVNASSEFADLETEVNSLTGQIRAYENQAPTRRPLITDDGFGNFAPIDLAGADGFPGPLRRSKRPKGKNGELLAADQSFASWVGMRGAPGTSGFYDEEPLPRDARFSDNDERPDDFSLGKLVRGMATGDWAGAETERRALGEGSDSAGGALVPDILSGRIIDKVRNATRVLQAGAQTVALDSDKVSIPRIATGVTGAWRKENDPVSEEAPTFDRVTFVPKSLAVLVRLSEELFEDAVSGSFQAIENDIVNALALELDRVALRGSGDDPEPKGILNQSGVAETPLGVIDNYLDLAWAIGRLADANHTANGILLAPRSELAYATLTDTTGQPLQPPAMVANVPRYQTNQIPTDEGVGEDESEIYVADWSQLMIGVRPSLGVRVRILSERYADNMQIGVRASLRADVQLAHPEAFQVLTGVIEGS